MSLSDDWFTKAKFKDYKSAHPSEILDPLLTARTMDRIQMSRQIPNNLAGQIVTFRISKEEVRPLLVIRHDSVFGLITGFLFLDLPEDRYCEFLMGEKFPNTDSLRPGFPVKEAKMGKSVGEWEYSPFEVK